MTHAAGAVDAVVELFGRPAAGLAYGEDVTIAEHMLQAAAAAEADGADDAVVVAALVHDVGHLVDAEVTDSLGNRHHARHGADLLRRWFPPEVTEPVRLHVAAKRYLVATDPGYEATLSPASVLTLAQQGGPLDADGRAAFEAEPHAEAALRVRRYDEAAKVADLVVPPLAHYRPHLARVARVAGEG